MKVCIAEKPSVAAEIAKVLGADRKQNGFFVGNDYQVTWVFGHLCELKEPHDYQPYLKRWDFHDLPIIPEKFGIKLKADTGVKRQFDVIAGLVRTADSVINCGDAGQEGELIQRWVMQMAGVTCPVYRLWISSLTEDAIRDGFAHLHDASEFDNVYAAGSARAIGDWLLGMNATRAYTLRYGARGTVLSIGRVQTPTLALIVQRYKEISNFTPEKYWELKTVYRDVTFSADVERFKTIEVGQALLDKISGKPFRVDDVQSKNGKESAPPLYDLTSLQVECNQKFGLSADDTLRIAQTLYERKFTTYPRVDTRFLTDDIYPQVKKILGGMTPYANHTAPLLGAAKLPKSKKVFNNLKVTDHHAIIPTGVCPTPDLQRNEKLVYDLIARRFIANFYPDSDIKQTTVIGSVEDIKFKVGGKQIVSPGWRVVYGSAQVDENDGKNEEQAVLPSFVVGETGEHAPKLVEKMTQPPKPYTEATLLRAMETAGKQVDDEELRMLMKENGIGRPSTRAAIIETLFRRHFVTKVKKNLVPTTTGISLVDTIQTPILKSVELTGLWEKKLRQIERGETSVQVFVSDMKQMVTDVVNTIRYASDSHRIEVAQERTEAKSTSQTTAKAQSSKAQQSTTQTAALTCPSCGRPILKGKSAWGCSGFKEGCHLVVPFVVMGKKLTQKQVETLLTKGVTPQMKGIEVDGQKKDGQLTFDKEYNIVFKPSEAKAASSAPLTCPLCGGNVLTGKSAWGCSNYVSGCRFRVPFVFMGRKLTATHLQVLIKKGKTNVLDGFIDEHGVQHKGGLVLQPEGGVALEEKV